MLKNKTDSVQSMTIQNLEGLDTKNGEMMHGIGGASGGGGGGASVNGGNNSGDKSLDNGQQQQLTAANNNKNGHISFSVASLLADTRPTRSNSPILNILSHSNNNNNNTSNNISNNNHLIVQTPSSASPHNHSSDDEYDSNQEDSIVDVEDTNSDQKDDDNNSSKDDNNEQFLTINQSVLAQQQRDFHREQIVNQGPIRPTPFSALAAAVYQATHPNWNHQGLVTPFGTPGPIFQSPTHFGVPNMNSGKFTTITKMLLTKTF